MRIVLAVCSGRSSGVRQPDLITCLQAHADELNPLVDPYYQTRPNTS